MVLGLGALELCEIVNMIANDPINASQADRLRIQIENAIMAGTFKPGERLDECRLAERYGTSRTPVREALRQLSSTGLIDIRPHKGAVVAKLGIRDVIEVFEVMAELEGGCARLAAKSCLRVDLATIRAALEECKAAKDCDDVQSYIVANEHFHETIYKASGNAFLMKLAIGVRNRVTAFRRLQLEQTNRMGPSFDEHVAIFTAIETGDADQADRLMQLHSTSKEADIRRFVLAASVSEKDAHSSPKRSYEAFAAK